MGISFFLSRETGSHKLLEEDLRKIPLGGVNNFDTDAISKFFVYIFVQRKIKDLVTF